VTGAARVSHGRRFQSAAALDLPVSPRLIIRLQPHHRPVPGRPVSVS